MKSPFSRLPVFLFSRFLILSVVVSFLITQPVSAQVVEIPDPNLREAIREQLQLPAGTPITQQQMGKLESLNVHNMGITDLTGLEYANLYRLGANDNQITDLTPLSGLKRLESLSVWGNPILDLSPLASLTQLKYLHLGLCEISDVLPLTGLMGLTHLYLHGNQISDIKPLAGLTQLTHLWLGWNLIMDVSPLSNLTRLTELIINSNPIIDYSPLEALSLTVFKRDETCELPALPIETRLQNRTFPSVFSAFGKPTDTQVVGLNHLSPIEQLARHDLTWRDPYFGLAYTDTPQGWKLVGSVESAQEIRDSLLNLNPNMIFLAEVRVRDAWIGYYPEDFPYWLRDEQGNIIKTPSGSFLITDFTQPGMQDIVVEQAIAVAQCGLFDGIFFDWFHEHFDVLPSYYSLEEELRAKDDIFKRIRAAVREDFLVIINTNRARIPRKAWGTNGTFMETLRDNQWNSDPEPYTHEGIKEIEDTLLWAEENFREPQINCLEGWGIPDESPDSSNNKRWMRLFTTMSLTLSDGYVLYGMDNSHQHIWYDFWDANLGRPIGPKAQPYQDIDGLYSREFTNGWAVYNRSEKQQTITLPRVSTGVSSNKQDLTHLLPDLDGEIYLRKGKPFDLNRDGTINVLDLILVSQHFGTTEADINGDGTTNILDLTLVAKQFNE